MLVTVDAFRDQISTIPFARHVGLDGVAGPSVRLPDDGPTRNHLGSQHAGALFTAGEFASAAPVLEVFGELADTLRMVVVDARIRFRAPALGPVTATAVGPHSAAQLRAELAATGRVRQPVEVELRAAETAVAQMTVVWHISRQRRRDGESSTTR